MAEKRKEEHKAENGVEYFRYTGDEDWQNKAGE